MNLKEIRDKKNITQKQMADKLGIRDSTYNQYENSKRNVPSEIAKEICRILDSEIEDIFLPVKFTVSK